MSFVSYWLNCYCEINAKVIIYKPVRHGIDLEFGFEGFRNSKLPDSRKSVQEKNATGWRGQSITSFKILLHCFERHFYGSWFVTIEFLKAPMF